MTLLEVKDAVQDGVGQHQLTTAQYNQYLGRARREIENRVSGHWMKAEKLWSTVVDQQAYPLLVGTGGGLNIPNFKDIRSSRSKKSTETLWSLPHTVYNDYDVLWSKYATDDTGEPEEIVIDGDDLVVFPPKPDAVFDMQLYYWSYTTNPAGDGDTDFLFTRFPELIIFASISNALQALENSPELAVPWAGMAEAEIRKLKVFVNDRGAPDEQMLSAWGGPYSAGRTRYRPYGRP